MQNDKPSFGTKPTDSILDYSGMTIACDAVSINGQIMDDVYSAAVGLHNFKPTNLKKWRKALANVRAGNSSCKVLFVGDSTTYGMGSTVGGDDPTRWKKSAVHFASDIFAAQTSLKVNRQIAVPWGSGAANDERIDDTGWSRSSSGWNIGAAGTLSFTPTEAVDTFDIYYFNGGTFNANVDGGSATLSPVASGVSKMTVTTTLGTHTLNIVRASSTVWIRCIEAYDSAKKHVSFWNYGMPGAVVDSFYNDTMTSVWLPRVFIPTTLQPDLSVVDLTINDGASVTDLQTYRQKLVGIIDYCLTTGDVILKTGVPWNRAAGIMEPYEKVVESLAVTYDVPWINTRERWISYTDSDLLGFHADTSGHPSPAGYADVAQLLVKALQI